MLCQASHPQAPASCQMYVVSLLPFTPKASGSFDIRYLSYVFLWYPSFVSVISKISNVIMGTSNFHFFPVLYLFYKSKVLWRIQQYCVCVYFVFFLVSYNNKCQTFVIIASVTRAPHRWSFRQRIVSKNLDIVHNVLTHLAPSIIAITPSWPAVPGADRHQLDVGL